jgi:hypothetical protein
MMRWSEVLLLLPPLVLIWVRLRTGAMPNRRLLFTLLMAMVVLGAALAWFGNQRAVNAGYVPAALQNGRIVPGHSAP